MFLTREAAAAIREGACYFPVVAILGPRQSGKTTLVKQLFAKHAYISLEDLDAREAAQSDPRTFLITQANTDGLIIDEFQYVPELLSYIQTTVDNEKRLGFFVLTGAQNFLMNRAIGQSLAGRVSIHTLLPLAVHELAVNHKLPDQIESMLYQGSYPAIYALGTKPDLLYKNYLQTYIERDVRELTQVGNLTQF